jgi:hypothetical protein
MAVDAAAWRRDDPSFAQREKASGSSITMTKRSCVRRLVVDRLARGSRFSARALGSRRLLRRRCRRVAERMRARRTAGTRPSAIAALGQPSDEKIEQMNDRFERASSKSSDVIVDCTPQYGGVRNAEIYRASRKPSSFKAARSMPATTSPRCSNSPPTSLSTSMTAADSSGRASPSGPAPIPSPRSVRAVLRGSWGRTRSGARCRVSRGAEVFYLALVGGSLDRSNFSLRCFNRAVDSHQGDRAILQRALHPRHTPAPM